MYKIASRNRMAKISNKDIRKVAAQNARKRQAAADKAMQKAALAFDAQQAARFEKRMTAYQARKNKQGGDNT